MKKSLKRGLAALLAAVMLTSGLAASAAAQPKADNVNLARLDGVVIKIAYFAPGDCVKHRNEADRTGGKLVKSA